MRRGRLGNRGVECHLCVMDETRNALQRMKPSPCIPIGFQLPCRASRLGPVSEPGLTPGEIGLVRMVMEQERKAAAEPQQLSRWGSVRASESVAGS